ncbi:MAG: beta-ketoacyl-[acyl-carrier-protein] synthase family protein [Aureispira sp.]
MTKVLITGMGIISAIGKDLAANRASLQAGKTGIKKAQHLVSRYKDIFPFGEVPYSTTELKAAAGITEETGITRTDVLAITAAQEAIEQAQWTTKELQDWDTAFISASTVGGMSMTQELYRDGKEGGDPSEYLSSYVFNAHTLKLMKRFGIRGLSSTFNTACSSSANAIAFGAQLIKSGRAKRAVVGGVDGLAAFTINGFNSLRILAPEATQSFDANRAGLTLGEGAAYLILEAEEEVAHKKIYGEVRGYGNTNDAFHASSMSKEATGIVSAIQGALNTAELTPQQIDYVNGHGTGTLNNDAAELHGLQQVFENIPPYHSTKTYTGHTLAAAGSVEAIFTLLALNHGELYPSLNFKTPIEGHEKNLPITTYKEVPTLQHALSNSFGFGGNCSALIFSKV